MRTTWTTWCSGRVDCAEPTPAPESAVEAVHNALDGVVQPAPTGGIRAADQDRGDADSRGPGDVDDEVVPDHPDPDRLVGRPDQVDAPGRNASDSWAAGRFHGGRQSIQWGSKAP